MGANGTPEWRRMIGHQLREAREFVGLSQEQAAHMINVHPSVLCRIEGGDTEPSASVLYKLSRLYKRPMESFCMDDLERLKQTPLGEAVADLSPDDQRAVLRFAQFLEHAGRVPA